MTRKIPRTAALEDLLALPEGVWHEAPKGIEVTCAFDGRKQGRARTIVPLSKSLARRLRPYEGEVLSAMVENGQLVVETLPARRTRKPRRA